MHIETLPGLAQLASTYIRFEDGVVEMEQYIKGSVKINTARG